MCACIPVDCVVGKACEEPSCAQQLLPDLLQFLLLLLELAPLHRTQAGGAPARATSSGHLLFAPQLPHHALKLLDLMFVTLTLDLQLSLSQRQEQQQRLCYAGHSEWGMPTASTREAEAGDREVMIMYTARLTKANPRNIVRSHLKTKQVLNNHLAKD